MIDQLRQAKTRAESLRDSFDALAAALGLEKDTLLLYYAFAEMLTGDDRRTVLDIMELEKHHLTEVADLIVRGSSSS